MPDDQPTALDVAPAAAAGPAKGEVTVQEPTRVQGLIARRAAESRATVPSFALTVEVDMGACQALRQGLGERVTITHLVIKACGLALRAHPRVNGSYRDARFELHERVNVGVMVATGDALVTPTVADADTTSLCGIAQATTRLVARAHAGELTSPETSGATFTVSNLGMLGVTRFDAVITPPHAAILAVGAITERPAVRDGAVVARPIMELTLACDHRIVYGDEGARFLQRVRELLEAPDALVA